MIEDFGVIVDKEPKSCEIVESEMAPSVTVSKTKLSAAGTTTFPEAEIELIKSQCSWMAHCSRDAVTLSEPEWHGGCSIWVFCKNGREVAHERSRSYPQYDPVETDKKIDNCLNYAPRTCASILSDLNAGQYCNNCFMKGRDKSPISLGNPNPIAQANIKIAKLVVSSKFNPRIVFEDECLATLAFVQRQL